MIWFLRSLVVACALFLAAGAWSQSSTEGVPGPDYGLWETIAKGAENAVDTKDDNNDLLEVFRARIVEYRSEFAVARQANAERIATIQTQIDSLGAVPETGDEPAEIATRRAQLNAQLETLQAPVRVASEAFNRADGLIREIDRIIRDRQTRRLLSLGPSPLNPVHWPKTVNDTRLIFKDISAETSALYDMERRQQFKENAPLVVLMFVFAMALIVRGRSWAGRVLKYMRAWDGRGTAVLRFLMSLFRIILPLSGLLLLTHAFRSTGMMGVRIDQIFSTLPIWGALLFGFRWLAERLFARDDEEALIPLADHCRVRARFYMLLLSILFVSRGIVALLVSFEEVDPATEAVLAFPIVVCMALVLFFMGLLLRDYRVDGPDTSDENTRGSGLARVLRGAGTAMVLVSVAAPLMAAIGYSEAGNALLYPTIFSMMVLGLVLALQRFSADVYCLVAGKGPEGREALVPVLMGFGLIVLALPILALTWGARVADLTELWATFLQGFTVGDTRISPTIFLTFAVIFSLGYFVTRLLQGTLRQNVLPKTKIDIGGQNALISGLGYVGVFLSGLIAITFAGIDLSSLAIVAGALSVGIGFGLQTIVSNFVSGIILLVERPISEGDWIEAGGQMGYVKHISVRSTRIETFDRTDVIIPNSDLISGTVTNYTRGNTLGRLMVQVGVAYGTDTKRVEQILQEIAEAQPMVLANPKPNILFMGFGADSLDFEIRVILRDVNWIMNVRSDINHAIAKRFGQEGIEIPFAQRDVWLRNPEVLKDAT